ncbi:MAG: hypothetical protein ABIF18_02040 [archaeon]
MGTLDKVIQMQQQGISDTEIYTQLQNEGVSPTEINDSLNQARIKNAVSPPENTPQEQAPQEMQASITSTPFKQPTTQQAPAQPMAREIPAQPVTTPQTPSPEIYPPQEQYQETQSQDNYYQETPQAYSQQDYYAPQAGQIDSETISEIAEQVVTEKLNEYKNKIGDIASFRNTIQDKVDDIDDRLKRIENNIDKLQQAIVGKIGEFGETSAMIHKDLDNLHGTVSKLMNPLIDNYNELKKMAK